MKNRDYRKKVVFSIIMALFAVVPTLNQMLVRIFPSTMGLLYTALYVVSLSLLVLAFVVCGFSSARMSPSALLLFVSCILAYSLTSNSRFESTLTLPFFVIFTLMSFLVASLVRVDPKIFLQAVMILPSFGVLFTSQIFEFNWRGTIQMDTSYSFLLPIISTVFYSAFYWRKDSKHMRVLMSVFIAINSYYFFMLLFHGSRAPSLSVVLSAIFVYVAKKREGKGGFEFDRARVLKVLLPIFLVMLNFSSILIEMGSFAVSHGIEAGTIQKSINLAANNDLDDGRGDVTGDALKAISRSPIYGNGLSTSLESAHQVHPHNFVLQLLHDGGIILMLIFMVPMLRYLRKWKKECTYDGFIMISLFFFGAVIGALFSLDMWMNSRLWMFMGILLSNDMYVNNRKHSIKVKKNGINNNSQLQ